MKFWLNSCYGYICCKAFRTSPAEGILWGVFWALRPIHPSGSVILMKLWGSSIEMILRHGCSPVGLLRIFRSTCSWEHLWGTASEHVNIYCFFMRINRKWMKEYIYIYIYIAYHISQITYLAKRYLRLTRYTF